MDTESLTGPEAVTKATESILALDPAPKTTVVHFKVSSQGITLTDLKHRSADLFIYEHHSQATQESCAIAKVTTRCTWYLVPGTV